MQGFRITCLLTLMCFLTTGCGGGGPATHKVTGKVTVKGGETVTQGIVQFSSGEFSGNGPINSDGTYVMSSAGDEDGVPAGKYKVVIIGTASGGGYNPDGPPEPEKPIINSKYESTETSGLEVEVPGGNYDFELDPPA